MQSLAGGGVAGGVPDAQMPQRVTGGGGTEVAGPLAVLPDLTSCSPSPHPHSHPLNPPRAQRPSSDGTSYSFNRQIHSTYCVPGPGFWGGKWRHGSRLKLLTAEGPWESQLFIWCSNRHGGAGSPEAGLLNQPRGLPNGA